MLLALMYLLDDRQYPWLGIIAPVSTNAQVDLLVKAILAIGSHQTEERVLRGLGYFILRKDGGVRASHMSLYGSESCERFCGFREFEGVC